MPCLNLFELKRRQRSKVSSAPRRGLSDNPGNTVKRCVVVTAFKNCFNRWQYKVFKEWRHNNFVAINSGFQSRPRCKKRRVYKCIDRRSRTTLKNKFLNLTVVFAASNRGHWGHCGG